MATADDSKFWSTRNYILAALGGTLAITAIIIVVSVVLRPAHISFSIIHASNSSASTSTSNDHSRYLNVTIAATNGSPKRTAVRYRSVLVDLKNSSSAAGTNMIHATVATADKDKYQTGMGPAIINASVLQLYDEPTWYFIGNRTRNGGFTVVVAAQVQFRVWRVPTRVYDIKVSCHRVVFPVKGSSKDAALEVKCAA